MSVTPFSPAAPSPHTRTASRRGAALAAVATLVTVSAAGCKDLTSGPTQTLDQDQTYQHAVTRIEFTVESGKVTLSPGGDGAVVVHRTLKFDKTQPVVSEVWAGDTLRVSATCPSNEDCSVDFTMQVPASVTVHTNDTAGDIDLRGLTGPVDLTLGTGNVDLANLTGSVKVNLNTGAVSGDTLQSTDVDVTAVTGDVILGFGGTPATVRAVTTTGKVHVTLPGGTTSYHVQAATTTGQVTVSVPQETSSSHSIVARATTGDVQVD